MLNVEQRRTEVFSRFSRTLLASAWVYYVDTPMQTSIVALE